MTAASSILEMGPLSSAPWPQSMPAPIDATLETSSSSAPSGWWYSHKTEEEEERASALVSRGGEGERGGGSHFGE